jgi:hypothetical protein
VFKPVVGAQEYVNAAGLEPPQFPNLIFGLLADIDPVGFGHAGEESML